MLDLVVGEGLLTPGGRTGLLSPFALADLCSWADRMAKVAAMKDSYYGKYTQIKNEKDVIQMSA